MDYLLVVSQGYTKLQSSTPVGEPHLHIQAWSAFQFLQDSSP